LAAAGSILSRKIEFTSKERDAETGLDYFGARYYSGAQGRFMTPDAAPPSIANPQSWNRYSYALNNPLSFIDTDGDLAINTITFSYKVSWYEYNPKTEKMQKYSVVVIVTITQFLDDDGNVAGTQATGKAANGSASQTRLSQQNLDKIGDTAAAIISNVLYKNMGKKLESNKVEVTNAIGLRETRLGIIGGDRGFLNPMQLACSSGTCPTEDRDDNISVALAILKDRVERFDLFKGLARYNAASHPGAYAHKVLSYYDQIRSSLTKTEVLHDLTPPNRK
jgi:RHS repeat-associated protein